VFAVTTSALPSPFTSATLTALGVPTPTKVLLAGANVMGAVAIDVLVVVVFKFGMGLLFLLGC
jgi:hypothetical protein